MTKRIFVGTALAAMCVGAICGCGSVGDPQKEPLSANAQENSQFVHDLFKKTGGDPAKVSTEDQAKLDQIYGRHIIPTGLFAALAGKAGGANVPKGGSGAQAGAKGSAEKG